MTKCEFYNVEVLDGFFSCIAYIYENNKRYIVNISYDIEFEDLHLCNCVDVVHNSNLEEYSPEELIELKNINFYELRNEILRFIEINGDLVLADY